MSASGFAAALLALALGVAAPGYLAARARWLGIRGAVERFVVAMAFGRLILAAVTVLLLELDASGLIAPLAVLAGILALSTLIGDARRGQRTAERQRSAPAEAAALAAATAAALLVVVAVVARSASLDASGSLVFLGTDASYDPLFYLATSSQLALQGLPLQNPYAAEFSIVGHYAFYGGLVGLRAIATAVGSVLGADAVARAPFELGFRALPCVDLVSLAWAALALARALGARAVGSACAAVCVVLGGHLAPLVNLAAGLVGMPVRDLLAWSLFGPLLLPVNPITAAAHGLFVALLLLVRSTPRSIPAAIVVGMLVGALAEQKLFLWAPALAGLLLAAAWFPPPERARSLRVAALAALAVSLPSIAEKIAFALGEGARFDVGFHACPGCLPRYLLGVAYAGGDAGFALFERARATDVLSASAAIATAGACGAFLAIALGARLLASRALWRGARERSEPARAAVLRVLGFGALAGAAATLGVGAPPHYLNGGQFLWAPGFALAIAFGLACDRWLATRGAIAVVAAVGLVGLGAMRDVVVQGFGAPPMLRISAAERALLEELGRRSAPGDVVLEPSWLDDADRPSPVPVVAGRRVVLTTSSAAAYLPSWERLFRLQNVERVYTSADRADVVRAAIATGARFVYAPAHRPLRAAEGPELVRLAGNEAGAIYEIRPGPLDR